VSVSTLSWAAANVDRHPKSSELPDSGVVLAEVPVILRSMAATIALDVRRLAQYRPFERGGLDLRAVLHDLVLAVAAIGDGEVGSLLECRQSFLDLWGLEVEIDELRPVVENLIEKGLAEKKAKGFRIPAKLMGELEATARASEETEERAFREWELAVRQVKAGVSDEDMHELGADLRQWLQLIISRHGAEAALMLYPEDERARRFFDEVDSHGFDLLPDREEGLKKLRAEALPLFIRSPTPDQRRFLAGLLNTSFYMTVLTIDPEAKQLIQAQMEGHRIYLDTNFLYAVLGAAPPEEVYSSRRLVQLSKELGFEFTVTPWTMAELRTSIAHSRRDIEQQQGFIRPELAETMLQSSGDKGFNRLFWQTYKDKKTQPKDVFDRLEHFDQELAKYGLVEISEGCEQVEQQQERIKLYASLLGAERWPYQKEPLVLEHDAMCRLLVEHLRGDGTISVSNASCWFLTYDTKLPRFAKRVPDNGEHPPELPFCVSPSVWIQIIRALTPRTEDFDRTIVDLLTSPFVGYRRALDTSVIQEIVGRMDHYEDASPELAIAVLTDTAKISEIEKAVSTEDEEKVEEVIKGAYSSKARELQEAIAASERRVIEADKARRDAEEKAAEIESAHVHELEEATLQSQKHQQEWDGEKQKLRDEIAETALKREQDAVEADRRIKAMERSAAEAEERKKRNRRLGAGVALIVLGIAAALVLSLVIVTNHWAVGGSVIGGTAIALVGIRILVGKKWGDEIVVWGGLIVAIAVIVVSIILATNH